MSLDDADPMLRWRMVLGEAAESQLGGCGAGWSDADVALSWLYGRDDEGAARSDTREGGSGPSTLTVPGWINLVHELFPQSTIERLERDAVDRYDIQEVVTNPDVLERLEPNPTLLKAVLRSKHLMEPRVLELARALVAEVVRRLMESMSDQVRLAFSGSPDRRVRSRLKVARNFDARRTLQANLRHTDPATGKLVVRHPWFFRRSRRDQRRWQLILVVDQSGSMLSSTIHAAVTAACFWRLPSVKTHLLAFDTQVVDLTRNVEDPVALLMGVQLGGGTDIAQAMSVARELIENPRDTIVVLITDFFEGGDANRLVRVVRSMCQQGSTVLGLAALDADACPVYDRDLAGRLAEEGAHIGAMTPDQLAVFVADVMSR